jgi:putative hydrolase of the HAD superfamily
VPLQAILFDLDETLLDRTATVDRYFAHQHQPMLGTQVPFSAYRQRFHELDRHGYADKYAVFSALAAEFALPVPVDTLIADFRANAWQHCELFPEALDVLTIVRRQGYRLGIITNGSVESQHAKLVATGLLALVDVALISAQEGMQKPDPRIFHRAAERLNVAPSACMFVGDNPATDMVGAAHAGYTLVWCQRHLPWPEELPYCAVTTITNLRELVPFLARSLHNELE